MLSNGFVVLFDDTEDHLCVYSPNEASIGRPALKMGVSPKAFSGDDYYGFSKVNGVQYLQYYHYNDGYYVGAAVPKTEMYSSRTIIALITSLASLILIMILLLTVTLTTEEEEELYAAMSEEGMAKGLNSAVYSIILPSGKRSSTVKAAARWDNKHIPWIDRTPEQKLLFMIGVMSGLLILYVAMSLLGVRTVFGDGSIIQYILSGNWDRGRNIFSFSACAVAIITTAIGVTLFRIPVRIISSMLGTRSETIGHLLLSVIKYGGAIGVLFYCLYLVGVDSTSLLASAGILSLVVGLGAQSLIKDILAGIFIVFEGEFRVGDIVTIGDYRGTVMDIGLRTTKILGLDGNIKIFNNSEISGVLNMTQAVSYALCQINIEYGQDIDYVEEVLERELPEIKKKYPKIIEGPDLFGVSSLEDSGVTLLIGAKCKENDIYGVRRALNKGVLQIFYKNNITVPFPHVTVMQKSEE
jgi:small conductance mechanosensitive channel